MIREKKGWMQVGRLYTMDQALLTEKPEIRVGDKVYLVDDRMRTFEKMNAALAAAAGGGKEFEIIIAHALGEDAAVELLAKDLSFAAMRGIVILIMAAMQDCTEAEAARRFQRAAE